MSQSDQDPDLAPDSEENANDIAIVGMAARLPGAWSTREYWRNLRDGVESITSFTDEELIAAGERPENLRKANYVKRGGVLQGMELFDGEFFGFSPKESAIVDPQHRHFLEVAWEALEDAGHPPERFEGSVGLFGGCGMGSYFYFNLCSHRELVDSVGLFLLRHTGNDKDFLITRVSYLLDLRGPAVSVQTACSTSLVAVHLACQSLLSGECDMALAGGSTIEIPHRRGYFYRENEVLSPDGHCHAFDHRGAGTVFGSGAGVVVLRRLEDALADRDHVYAVIKGSAVNNDGARKVGYLAPSVDGQAAAMAEAHAVAGIDPATIEYIECHGTGTYMGDPIEVAALTQAFRQRTDKTGYCRLASVKTNIGHLDTAAGVASLIKAALALSHAQIPPSLNFEKPNPTIDFENSPFLVNAALYDWPAREHPRRAAINSLGVGGTNAHVVLEEAPPPPETTPAQRDYQLLVVSGRNAKAMEGNCRRLAAYLREEGDEPALADVAYTLAFGRRAFNRRRIVAARSTREAAEWLETSDPRKQFVHTPVEGKASVVFMLSGGGSQYPRMGLDLYAREPLFKEHVDRGIELLARRHGTDLRAVWFVEPDQVERAASEFEKLRYQLPAIFIVEYALYKLWESWGVTPQALIGHSLGENTAACIAGVLSYEDCLDLVNLRAAVLEKLEVPGTMLSVPLPPAEVEPLLPDGVELALVNTPTLCAYSGTIEAIERLEAVLREREIDVGRIAVPVAAHSYLQDPALPEFRRFLQSIQLAPPRIPIVSNTTGAFLTEAQATDPEYWVGHLRRTVRFADGIGTLLATPGRVLIEVGPGKMLGSLARQHPAAGADQNILSTLRHPAEDIRDDGFFLAALGRAWAAGVEIDLARLWEGEQRRRVPLPTYAWNHQPYFIERVEAGASEDDYRYLTRLPELEQFGFRPSWVERPAEARADDPPETWLLFMDQAGIGRRLKKRLTARGHTVVTVEEADAYHCRNDLEYGLSPERGRPGYDALVRDLMQRGKVPSRIVHLWLTTDEERYRPGSSFFHRNQEAGFYSLFYLAQALGEENAPRPLHMTVVSSGMQRVADEALPYPEKATALGPCKVIPREFPGFTVSSVDLALEARDGRLLGDLYASVLRPLTGEQSPAARVDALCDLLEAELRTAPDNATVALRNGRRYILRYEPYALSPLPEGGLPLRVGGVYLVTGGLGGLGLTLAEALARRAAARLILLGRRALPEREAWSSWLSRRGKDDPTSRVIERVQAIEAAGGEVVIESADVTNVEEMQAVVARAKERYGVIHGVFHTAGIVDDALIQLKTESAVEDVFAPKIHGTYVLDGLFGRDELDLTVLYSSTSSITAPAGQVDYVAANAFLNAFAHSRADGRRTRTVAVDWGIWNEVGMAAAAFAERDRSARGPELGPTRHPLFDERIRDTHGRTALRSRLSPQTHWLLDEHRTNAGHALIPGTGYIELASAALTEYGERAPFEIRDLFFLRPLHVADGRAKEMRVLLHPTDQGYGFEVRSECTLEGRRGFVLHAQANLQLLGMPQPPPLPLSAIEARCDARVTELDPAGMRIRQEEHIRFGPRWRVLHQVRYGKGEALGRLELPEAFAGDLAHFALHPALLDLATGFAMELVPGYAESGALWVPVSYGSIKVHAPLTRQLQSWVKSNADNRADGDFVRFDVVIADPSGKVLCEVAEFAMKRMPAAARDELDFAVADKPARGDVELESTSSIGSVGRERSPAEQQLQRNLEQGIQPDEGAEALLRVLGGEPLPQVVVSSLDLNALIKQAEHSAEDKQGGGAKFERPELDSEYVAPRDEIERTLVGFWEDLLGVDKVGVADSFFDLGGHSLIAVRLFSMIKKAYQAEFPISVLFEAPTIERCAALIKEVVGDAAAEGETDAAKPAARKARKTRYKHLVAMHPAEGGPQTPFFLVAGMFGNVLNLRHLAHLVGTDRPFYGLQARGLYGDEPPHETFEEMAEAYIAEMRTVQPHGPYLIGGFSGGGLTAFEIAQQLKAAGEEVGLLLLLDSRLPQTPELTARDRALIQMQRLQRRGPRYVQEWARDRVAWEVGRLQRRFFPEDHVEQHTPDQFHNQAIEAAFRAALPGYRMRHYHGRITLFRPKLDEHYVLGPDRVLDREREWVWHDNGFGQYCDAIEVYEMPGDHDAMVLEPNVRVMAQRLRKCIEQAESEHGIGLHAPEESAAAEA